MAKNWTKQEYVNKLSKNVNENVFKHHLKHKCFGKVLGDAFLHKLSLKR